MHKQSSNPISHRNRGMDLENALNISNQYYIEINRALIYKKPTPIGIVDVKYNDNHKVIDKAYFKCPSTLDYNGLYRGKYLEFEAKETINKTSFPLKNIHPHQILHIRKVIEHQGLVFLIIKINNEVYFLDGQDFIDYLSENTRQSLPYLYIKEKGHFIKEEYLPCLDYLKIVDEIYFKGDKYGNS